MIHLSQCAPSAGFQFRSCLIIRLLPFPKELKAQFINTVFGVSSYPQYLNFHRERAWYYWGTDPNLVIKEKEETRHHHLKLFNRTSGIWMGIWWVSFRTFKKNYSINPVGWREDFLHPLSHELGFMTIWERLFFRIQSPWSLHQNRLQPDYLTLILYEMKTWNLRFENRIGCEIRISSPKLEGWVFWGQSVYRTRF